MEYKIKFDLSDTLNDIIVRTPECLPQSFFEEYFPMPDCHYEERVIAVYLNTRLKPLVTNCVGIGDIRASVVNQQKVYRTAILAGAPRVILVHNHPSGGLEFSRADIKLHDDLKKGLDLLNCELVDFLIWNGQTTKSIKQNERISI